LINKKLRFQIKALDPEDKPVQLSKDDLEFEIRSPLGYLSPEISEISEIDGNIEVSYISTNPGEGTIGIKYKGSHLLPQRIKTEYWDVSGIVPFWLALNLDFGDGEKEYKISLFGPGVRGSWFTGKEVNFGIKFFHNGELHSVPIETIGVIIKLENKGEPLATICS